MLRSFAFWTILAIAIPSSKMQGILNTLIPPEGLTVLEGGTVNFGCSASNCVQSLQWLKNNTVRYSVVSSGSCLSSILYTASPLDPDRDSGIFLCRAQLANGTTVEQPTGVITVARIVAPHDQYVLYGAKTSLNCSIPSLPGAVILWANGSAGAQILSSSELTAASLYDDHAYTCIGVLNGNTYGYKTVNLHVIAPPTIVASPPAENVVYPSQQLVNLTVHIQSRPWSSTTITWYKDGIRMTNTSNITMTPGDLLGTTSIIISREAARLDGGIYTVVAFNNLLQMSVQASFALRLIVLPAKPVNINVTSVTPFHAILSWNLSMLTPDEAPDSVRVTLMRLNGSTASEMVLAGAVKTTELQYLPGLIYKVKLTTQNVDGNVTSSPLSFSAPYGAPQVSSWRVSRTNYTAYAFIVHLNSNGGADIAHINISYRLPGSSSGWLPAVVILDSSQGSVVLSGIATSNDFTAYNGPYEFQLSLANEASLASSLMQENETVDLPGAPAVSVMDNTSSRLSSKLTVLLSNNGTPPILQVVVVVTSSQGKQHLYNSSGPYLPGTSIYISLDDLQQGVQYVCYAYAVNQAGAGYLSSSHTFTIPEPPMLWIIAAVITPTLLVMLGVALALLALIVYRRKKRTLHIGLEPRPVSPLKVGDSSSKEDSSQFGSSSKTTLHPVSENGSEEEEQKYPRYTYRINPSPDQSVRSIQLPSFLGIDSSRESLSVTAVSQATDV